MYSPKIEFKSSSFFIEDLNVLFCNVSVTTSEVYQTDLLLKIFKALLYSFGLLSINEAVTREEVRLGDLKASSVDPIFIRSNSSEILSFIIHFLVAIFLQYLSIQC